MNTIVLDTSAVKFIETFEIIEKAEKVIITSIVLRELNYLKDRTKGLELHNQIQKLLKDSAMDSKCEKYVVIDILANDDECHDETVARNASNIQDAVVVTNDYGMCNFCKLHKVEYLLVLPNANSNDENEEQMISQPEEFYIGTKPYQVIRKDEKFSVICTVGSIELLRDGKTERILSVNEKTELFENDLIKVSISKLKTRSYLVMRDLQNNRLYLKATR